MFEKNLNIGLLLDFYGDVLNERRRDALDFYYNNDMSLAEIADAVGITRQGARGGIKKGEEELLFLEEKLGLAARHRLITEEARELIGLAESTVKESDGEEMQTLLSAIRRYTDSVLEKN